MKAKVNRLFGFGKPSNFRPVSGETLPKGNHAR
jgi:hypothetical protein